MATFTPPEYITQADAELRHGVLAVTQLYDDDGDNSADASAVEWGIREASSFAQAYMIGHFGASAIEQLADDYRFKAAVVDLFMAVGGERRSEWRGPDGRSPHWEKRKRAEEMLDLLGKGLKRLGAEETHGTNQTKRGRSNVDLPRVHIFATSRTNQRGSGGF